METSQLSALSRQPSAVSRQLSAFSPFHASSVETPVNRSFIAGNPQLIADS
jgi:hypothetical protein